MITLRNRDEKLLLIDYRYRGEIEAPDHGDSEALAPALRHALITANVERATRLIAAGADPRRQDDEGAEPIHDAALGGSVELIELLLELGAPPDQRSARGRTPLSEAVYAHRGDAVRRLLHAGADPGHCAAVGAPPIIEAGYRAAGEIMRLLVEFGADPNQESRFGQGLTPLMYAAQLGDAGLVRLLVERGARLEAADLHRRTALIHAALHGQSATAAALLEAGADVHAADSEGNTALWWANKDRPELVELLLKSGARADVPGSNGRTPLSDAVGRGNPATVRLLLEAGAPVTPPGGKGWSALMSAAAAGHDGMARLILGMAGADVNYRDEASGQTALISAAAASQPGIVRLVLAHGAMVDASDGRKQTALHHAAARGCAKSVKILLEAGAATEVVDGLGYTPLMLAASTRVYWKEDAACRPACRALLDAGARIDAADNHGWTAMSHAVYDGHLETARTLKAAGGDVLQAGADAASPLMIAMQRGVPDPKDERKSWRPPDRASDPMYDTIVWLLPLAAPKLSKAETEQLRKLAGLHRCPETLELIAHRRCGKSPNP